MPILFREATKKAGDKTEKEWEIKKAPIERPKRGRESPISIAGITRSFVGNSYELYASQVLRSRKFRYERKGQQKKEEEEENIDVFLKL